MSEFWDTKVMAYLMESQPDRSMGPGSVWKPLLATGAGLSDILGLSHDEFIAALEEIEPKAPPGALPLDLKAEYDEGTLPERASPDETNPLEKLWTNAPDISKYFKQDAKR